MSVNRERWNEANTYEDDFEHDDNSDIAAFTAHAFDKTRRRIRRENLDKERVREEFHDSFSHQDKNNSYSSKETLRNKITGRIAVKQAISEYESPDRSADEEILSESKIHIPDTLKEVDWQTECFEKIKNESNVILSAPTGSGKTRVFIEWAKEKQHGAEREGISSTVYITAPIKALSNQRFRELKEQGLKVGLETGDIKNIPDDANYICCTQEIFTNKYCDDENSTLIMDEFHYMFENPDRQRSYIDGLHNAKAKNILTCSATMGDLAKTVSYVNKVSDRNFASYETDETLTNKTFEGEISPSNIRNAFVVSFSVDNIIAINKTLCEKREEDRNTILDLLSDTDRQQEELQFEQRRDKIRELADKYQVEPQPGMKYGVANYYGRMLPKEKLYVEELFENKLIDTVVGTDALALGVNFPIENVVFTQLTKYQGRGIDAERITKNQFDQLCGRAGRKGYFDHGHIYYSTLFHNKNGYPTEERGYNTGEVFDELIDAENENISVELGANMRELLSGKRSVEEEANYIVKFSTQYDESDLESVRNRLEASLSEILDNPIDEDHPEYDEEYHELIASVYDETIPNYSQFGWTTEYKNRQLLSRIIQDSHTEDIDGLKLSTASLFDIYTEHPDNFNEMLQFRKYIHSLPRQYRKMYNLTGLDKIINERDHTALNSERGALQVSEINDINPENTDYELLVKLHSFSSVENEVYDAIENGRISAEKIFNALTPKEQWKNLEKFKNDFGCTIGVDDVLSNMPDRSLRKVVEDELLTIFRLGGDTEQWLWNTDRYYDVVDAFGKDDEPITLDLLVKASRQEDFNLNLPYMADGTMRPSKDAIKTIVDRHSVFAETIFDQNVWNYLNKECEVSKQDILKNIVFRDKKKIPDTISELLKNEDITTEDILDTLPDDLRYDLRLLNGQLFGKMVEIGFSAEDLYKRYIDVNYLYESDIVTLLGYGIPAQEIINSIDRPDKMLEFSKILTNANHREIDTVTNKKEAA